MLFKWYEKIFMLLCGKKKQFSSHNELQKMQKNSENEICEIDLVNFVGENLFRGK